MSDSYICPVCGYAGLLDEPYSVEDGGSYEICWSCGFEFGVTDDDRGYTHASYRAEWIARGMPWNSGDRHPRPPDWDPKVQLARLLA